MEIIETTKSSATLKLSRQELVIFNNAMNEICNGIDVFEFDTRIGATKDEVRLLLAQVHDLIDRIR